MDFDEYLASLDEIHDPDKVKDDGGFREFNEPGAYLCNINSMKLKTVNDKECLEWTFEAIHPEEHRGARKQFLSFMLTPPNLDWLKKNILRCGYTKPFKWSELRAVMEDLTDTLVWVKILKGKDSRNVYFDKNEIGEKWLQLRADHFKTGSIDDDIPF